MSTSQMVTFETDYEFRPSPAGLPGIPLEQLPALLAGDLHLVLRRGVGQGRWCLVPSKAKPARNGAWPPAQVVSQLAEAPDLDYFAVRDEAAAVIDCRNAAGAWEDVDLPFWTRYSVRAEAVEKHFRRRLEAEVAAASFNAHFGKARCRLKDLPNEALALICMQRNRLGEQTVWMHRSIHEAALHLVRAGFATVSPDGCLKMKDRDVEPALEEWSRRCVAARWTDPAANKRKPRPTSRFQMLGVDSILYIGLFKDYGFKAKH